MIQLYCKGDDHIIRGHKCNLLNVHVDQMAETLEAGYVKDPSELYPKPKPKAKQPALAQKTLLGAESE